MYVYFLCGLVCTCIHESDAELICFVLFCFFFRRFNVLCYASGFYMLLFLRQLFMMRVCVCVCASVCVCVCVVVVIVHWHCSSQLSMFNVEKRYRNKIIIIIINIMMWVVYTNRYWCDIMMM